MSISFRPRALTHALRKAIKTFPAVVVTGPRQSGKTTLLKAQFSRSHGFISLENPDVRLRAKDDPVGFLNAYPPPVILDEIQYVPELLPFIKTLIDENRRPGRWLLTGSQNFTLMQGVSESLAGRAAVLTLLPFSFSEYLNRAEKSIPVSQWLSSLTSRSAPALIRSPALAQYLLRGSYPEIASNARVNRELWCGSYLATYIERDIRNLATIGDLSQFQRFVKLCATRTGQILNLSDMARDIGISVPTAKRWISILETGHQIYLLYPYYRNIGKRLIKSPKLYFTDTALASYLLGIHDTKILLGSPHYGSLFETLVVMDILKRFYHGGEMPALFYLRTRDGLEIDLVLEVGEHLHLFEIKTSATITPVHAAPLIRLGSDLGNKVATTIIISASSKSAVIGRGVHAFNWADILSR